MQRKSTRIGIIRSAASTLLTLLIFDSQVVAGKPTANSTTGRMAAMPRVTAQSDDGVVLLFSSIPGGIARGQTLRIGLGNLIRLDGREQNPVEVRAQVKLLDALGRTVAQTAELSVAQNQFRSFNFNRDRLPLPGEPTGRLQVREELTVRCVGVNRDEALIIRQRALEFFPSSSELIDNATGKSEALTPGLPLTSRLQTPISSKANTIGLTYGQTLRLSALNDDTRQSNEPIRLRIKLTDARGVSIAQSAEVTIPAGQFHSIDFNRNDLVLPGEPGTGRLQLVWSVEASTSGSLPHLFLVSVETVENSSGLSTTSKVSYGYLSMPQS